MFCCVVRARKYALNILANPCVKQLQGMCVVQWYIRHI